MTGKTHMAVGLAASSLILQHPQNRIEFGVFLGFALIGSLMPDVDQKQSILGHFINIIMIGILTFLIVLKFIGFLPESTTLLQSSSILKGIFQTLTEDILPLSNFLTLIGSILTIISIIMARKTGHRHFAHSLLGLISFSSGIFLLFGTAILKPFIIGYVSHMFIDLFNHKGEKLFYPSKFGISFKLVRTGDKIDHAIAFIAIALFLAFNLA